eukprot:TRINITY_DN4814_c0_g1_i3.p1 TRINITY_DN4814_c0_g1~~TRINITY_DN4814_c0_g1_i3.p1  ORF type:complete len:497 (-),score=50.72 TRINITY_DN4814_c0_g1_i3:258-1748(-)
MSEKNCIVTGPMICQIAENYVVNVLLTLMTSIKMMHLGMIVKYAKKSRNCLLKRKKWRMLKGVRMKCWQNLLMTEKNRQELMQTKRIPVFKNIPEGQASVVLINQYRSQKHVNILFTQMGQDPNERSSHPLNEVPESQSTPAENTSPSQPVAPTAVIQEDPTSTLAVDFGENEQNTDTNLNNDSSTITNTNNNASTSASSSQNPSSSNFCDGLPVMGPQAPPPGYSVDAVQQQQNEIYAETKSKQPLIGQVEDLMALKVEYSDDSSFLPKIAEVAQSYSRFRRMRGDGSCFYRGFLFSYLEQLVRSQNLDERDRMLRTMDSVRKAMKQYCQDFIIDEFSEPFIALLQLIGRSDGTGQAFNLQGLVSYMQDESNNNQLIFFMRLLTSHAIKDRQDHFAPFILANYEDCATVEDFCQRYVEPINEESDEYQIVALTGALNVPVRVVYVDSRTRELGGTGGKSGIYIHDFIPEECNEVMTPKIHLLYRPGHYDVLYYGQ